MAAYVTREGAENLIMKAIQRYEEQVVQPRHEENQKALRKIQNTIYIGYGIVLTIIFFVKLLWK